MSAKNSPVMMDVIFKIQARIEQTQIRGAAQDFSTDTKLAWLVGRVGNIAQTTRRKDAVLDVTCCAFTWMESLHLSDMDILQRVADERARQRELFTAGKHNFRVDSPVVDWTRKLRVLTEEVGEVAQAIDQLETSPRSKILKRYFLTELIQVAAVGVAWLESMEGK